MFHDVQSAHASWCNKKFIVCLCVCTGDNAVMQINKLLFVKHLPLKMHIPNGEVCGLHSAVF